MQEHQPYQSMYGDWQYCHITEPWKLVWKSVWCFESGKIFSLYNQGNLEDTKYFQLNLKQIYLLTFSIAKYKRGFDLSLSSIFYMKGHCGRDRMVDLQLHMQLVPITTKVVSSNSAHGTVYSIQQYVIKFVSDLRQVGGFLPVLRFPPLIKLIPLYNWKIVESGVEHHKPTKPTIFDILLD